MRIQMGVFLAFMAGCGAEVSPNHDASDRSSQRNAVSDGAGLALFRAQSDTYLLHPRTVVADTEPETAALAWFRGQAGLQLDVSELVLQHTRQGRIGTYLRFGQVVDGLPVFDAQVVVHLLEVADGWEIRDVNLNHAITTGYEAPPATVDVAGALEIARSAVGAVGIPRYPDNAALGVDPRLDSSLVYRVDLGLADGGSWRVIVDARSGEVLAVSDRRRTVDGLGLVFDPHPVATTGNTALTDNGDNNQQPRGSEKQVSTDNQQH